jgi:hypothetical protein
MWKVEGYDTEDNVWVTKDFRTRQQANDYARALENKPWFRNVHVEFYN